MTRSAAPAGPSRDDEFDGAALDKDRWNAIVRENPGSYTVAGGALTITTEPGDIYSGDTNPPPNNFILQSADHAGEDWVIETKLDSHDRRRLRPGRPDRLRRTATTTSSSTRSRTQGRRGSTASSCATEVAGTPTGPDGVPDPEIAAGTGTEFWLRLTKDGTTYSGEYSFDGTTWTPGGHGRERDGGPDFGVFAFGPQADGQGDTVAFDYFLVDGRDATDPCECVPTGGDSFDSGALDKTKWNAIVREQEDLYAFDDGWLEVQTVNGDIYTGRQPGADEELHPPGAGRGRPGLGDRDPHRRSHAQRRLRAGRPAGLRRRRQLRQVRHHLRRRADGPQPARAAVGDRRGRSSSRNRGPAGPSRRAPRSGCG